LFNDKASVFDDSYTNDELTMFMLKQEEIYSKSMGDIKCNFKKKNCFDESLSMIGCSLDHNRVVFFEPADEEIVEYLRRL